jgi:WD40 repeat protein
VYALGAILYECLTGRPPFEGVTALETLKQVCAQEPIPPAQVRGGIPRDLSTVCLKCLAKEPKKRYSSAAALADDLCRFLDGRPVTARPAGSAERFWRWCRRRPAVAGLSLGLALALVFGLAGILWQWREADRHANAETAQRQRAEVAERQAQAELWDAYLAEAQARRRTHAPGQSLESLAAIRKALQLPLPAGRSLDTLRNEAAAALALPDVEVVHEWESLPRGSDCVTFDATLERYAVPDARGTVSVRRVADDAEIARIPGPGSGTEAVLSPDGRFLAVHHQATLRLQVWRLTDPQPVLVHEDGDVGLSGVMDFTPDNQRLLYCLKDNRMSLVTLADRQVTRWLIKGTDPGGLPMRSGGTWISPDSRQVMFRARVDGHDTLQVCDVRTGAVQASLPHPARISYHAWHPGGRMIATCCNDQRVRLWDTATWQPTLVLAGHKNFGMQCVFTPDGNLLLSNDWDWLLRVWEVPTGRQVFTTPMSYDMHHFSPDGRLPVCLRPAAKLLRVVAGRGFRTVSRHSSAGPGAYFGYHNVAPLHPDGRLLAISTEEMTCALVDPISGAELGVLPIKDTLPLLFETSGALLTYGTDALYRWPVRGDAATGRYRVGPPQLLFRSSSRGAHGSSADGRIVAIPNYSRGALLVHRDRPGPPLILGPQEDVWSCAVSPDGHWVATGSRNNTQGIGAKVWDGATGRLVKELRMDYAVFVGFSPDGNWLLTSNQGVARLWKVGTWEEGLHVEATTFAFEATPFAFSPDGQMLAVAGDGAIRLLETASGREYVRLNAPEVTRLAPQCFTPDGAHLIALGRESRALHVWDLRLLRRQLAELGLDWDAPAYPPESASVRKPLRVEVVR